MIKLTKKQRQEKFYAKFELVSNKTIIRRFLKFSVKTQNYSLNNNVDKFVNFDPNGFVSIKNDLIETNLKSVFFIQQIKSYGIDFFINCNNLSIKLFN